MPKTYDEINEISKKTLSSYIDKSFDDGNKAHKEIKDAETPEEKEAAEKRLSKRNQGVIKASKKYFKEDVEELDEMSGAGVTATDLHKHLKKSGWVHARSSGGHDVFTHEKAKTNIAVPRHRGDLNRLTVLQILKKSKINEELNEADEVDKVTMDVPLFIRLLEYAREDAVDDAALHELTEKVIKQSKEGTLTMDSYKQLVKESVETDHLQTTLADKDIDSKIEGDKVIVHRDNVAKAKAHVKKLGLDHKVVAGLHEEELTEEVRLLRFSETHLLESFDDLVSLEEDLSDKLQSHVDSYRESGHEVKVIDRGSDGKTAKFISKNKSGKVRMHTITPTSARHEVLEPGDDHDEDDKPKGRGRPAGSKSGSRY